MDPTQIADSTTDPAKLANPIGNLPVAPVNPVPSIDPTTQRRLNDLMSARDRATADAAAAQKRLSELQEELERRGSLLQGATQTTEQLLQAKSKIEAEHHIALAELAKMRALANHPDLLPYADFIPASGKEDEMKAAIERFQATRAADLARQTPPVTPRGTEPRPAITNPLLPPAPPAAPTAPDPQAAFQSFQSRVRALDLNKPDDREKWDQMVREAELQARQQHGVS